MAKIYIKRMCLTVLMASLVFFSLQTAHAAGKKRTELPRSGKTTAPLSIFYTVPPRNAVGDKVRIAVTVKALSDVKGLTLKLAPGEGLSMEGGTFMKNYGDQPRNTEFTETVAVTPSVDGILYLNIFASGTFNGRKMTRTGAVPVQVGANARKMLKKSGQAATDDKGQKIIIMPAEEKK